ncbi:helix-turn-helix transcriptional regulator [Bifidobacterium sp. ESL0728]|uniref:helix-turn-helix domain-containing protein n=1 Tax=Bifidobacterium sp. ESL0728 TaxID=2983220 RepID=UPI0023F63DA2|nr:helix-turn-helix transcriptional regulator [Bifidobacterium sp. ESL0728]WEV59712.1 helix-turn-helix transcriptional regulator [Bifidobacterium sp. ESL0728]
MSNVNAEVGHRVDEIRRKHGMTKRALAEMSEIPYSSFNAKISGRRGFDVSELVHLSEATREKPSEFFPPEIFNIQDAICSSQGQPSAATALADTNQSKEMDHE